MIQANDLRLGNRVLHQSGIITIQQLLPNTVVYDTQMKVQKDTALVSTSYDITYHSEVIEEVKEAEYTELAPIPLSPAVLAQCGFKNFLRDSWIFKHSTGHIELELSEKGLQLRQPTATWIMIKYLHQLQNFIYVITGKELVIDL